jgi:hypothetical protein
VSWRAHPGSPSENKRRITIIGTIKIKEMKLKFTLLGVLLYIISFSAMAQDEDSPGLTISGSVDTYYKYDFSGSSQIGTSFAGAQNSIGIGMVDIAFSQTWGKAFVCW